MRQFEQLRDTWVSDTAEPISAFVDIADHVLVRYLWRGTGEGPESNIELTALYTVRKGKIFSQEFFGITPKRSRPWASRSRRCRRRTWTWSGHLSRHGTRATWMLLARFTTL